MAPFRSFATLGPIWAFGGLQLIVLGGSLLTWLHFEKGCSLWTLQKITDHADIGNLSRYLDIDQQEADEAWRSAWD